MNSATIRIITVLSLAVSCSRTVSAGDAISVFKTQDHGRSWSSADEGLPIGIRVNAFGTLDRSIFAGTDAGIFVSRDEARSWRPVADGNNAAIRIRCFATSGGTAFAGTDAQGILVSKDMGKTWESLTASPATNVRCLLAHDDVIHAGTDRDGVFTSFDAGKTWSPLREGFPELAQTFALAMVENRLFAALYADGLHAWNEADKRWTKVDEVTPLALAGVNGTLIAGHNPGGLFHSDDLGMSWSKGIAAEINQFAFPLLEDTGRLSSEAPVWELGSDNEIAFAGASDGIFYTEDRGRTWAHARSGLPENSPGISFLVTPTFVLAGVVTRMLDAK